jgi:hypothetical protein
MSYRSRALLSTRGWNLSFGAKTMCRRWRWQKKDGEVEDQDQETFFSGGPPARLGFAPPFSVRQTLSHRAPHEWNWENTVRLRINFPFLWFHFGLRTWAAAALTWAEGEYTWAEGEQAWAEPEHPEHPFWPPSCPTMVSLPNFAQESVSAPF